MFVGPIDRWLVDLDTELAARSVMLHKPFVAWTYKSTLLRNGSRLLRSFSTSGGVVGRAIVSNWCYESSPSVLSSDRASGYHQI